MAGHDDSNDDNNNNDASDNDAHAGLDLGNHAHINNADSNGGRLRRHDGQKRRDFCTDSGCGSQCGAECGLQCGLQCGSQCFL